MSVTGKARTYSRRVGRGAARRALRGVLLGVFVLLIAAWVAQYWWFLRVGDFYSYTMWLRCGYVELSTYSPTMKSVSPPFDCWTTLDSSKFRGWRCYIFGECVMVDRVPPDDRPSVMQVIAIAGGPWTARDDYEGIWEWGVPMWCLVAPLAVAIWLTRDRRRRCKSGFCLRCGYNLTGNVSGICPECGTPIPASVDSKPDDARRTPGRRKTG